jgi:hypothetical protein
MQKLYIKAIIAYTNQMKTRLRLANSTDFVKYNIESYDLAYLQYVMRWMRANFTPSDYCEKDLCLLDDFELYLANKENEFPVYLHTHFSDRKHFKLLQMPCHTY